MATLNDTDLFLVQNNNSTEKITFAQLKEQTVLNDTDLLLINNGTKTNKVTWGELKTEIGPSATAPVVGSVSLVESNPNSDPRFTSQEFVASVSMTEEGTPVSTKKIDAYVEGSITQQVQFDEPLENSGSSPGETYSDSVTSSSDWMVANPPTNMFDGDLNNPAILNSNSSIEGTILWEYEITKAVADLWNQATALTFYQVPGSGGTVNRSCMVYRNTTSTVLMSAGSAASAPMNLYGAGRVTDWVAGDKLLVGAFGGQTGGDRCYGITYTIDGVATTMKDGLPTKSSLTFAAGTDMDTLAAGDSVTQPAVGFDEPLESVGSSSTNYGQYLANISNPGGFNGDPNDCFDGNSSTGVETQNNSESIQWDVPKEFQGAGQWQLTMDAANTSYYYQLGLVDNTIVDGNMNTNGSYVLNISNGASYAVARILVRTNSTAPTGLREFYRNTGGGWFQIINGTNSSLNFATGTDMDTLAAGDKVEQGATNGTVGSITGTTVTLSSSSGTWTDGVNVTGPQTQPTGIVGSIDGTSVVLSSGGDQSWTNGTNVTGPQKTVTIADDKKYLKFDSSGNVSDLLDAPQSPAYETTGTNPSLTFKFPAKFLSDNAPDDELGDGTKLVVEVTATNTAGSDGPKTAEVQPEGDSGPDVNLNGLTMTYGGSGAVRNIINGINLVDNDAFVWVKTYTNTNAHHLFDTVRGATKVLKSNLPDQEDTYEYSLMEFLENGFKFGADVGVNGSGETYVAYTFQKAAGYCDVVKYTGNGQTTNVVPHELGQAPSIMIVKNTGSNENWMVYHKDVTNPERSFLQLNNFNAAFYSPTDQNWAGTSPDANNFYVGQSPNTNENGKEHIAYLFGDTPGLIKCGTTTHDTWEDLGFEPQWILIKQSDGSNGWGIYDYKRGWSKTLLADQNYANVDIALTVQDNRFQIASASWGPGNYLYMAIAKPTTRSLTQEEFTQQAAKFATYNNRRDVHQGEQAMAQREALMKELQAAGASPPAINKLLGGTSS